MPRVTPQEGRSASQIARPIDTPWIETDCTIEHNGQTYESGGAAIWPEGLIAYVSPREADERDARPWRGQRVRLETWRGELLGHAVIASVWRTPRSWITSHAFAWRASVDGVAYYGRAYWGFGGYTRGRANKTDARP